MDDEAEVAGPNSGPPSGACGIILRRMRSRDEESITGLGNNMCLFGMISRLIVRLSESERLFYCYLNLRDIILYCDRRCKCCKLRYEDWSFQE